MSTSRDLLLKALREEASKRSSDGRSGSTRATPSTSPATTASPGNPPASPTTPPTPPETTLFQYDRKSTETIGEGLCQALCRVRGPLARRKECADLIAQLHGHLMFWTTHGTGISGKCRSCLLVMHVFEKESFLPGRRGVEGTAVSMQCRGESSRFMHRERQF